jgi:RNA polymerase sigma factor (sigma-70 family)
MDSPDPHWIRVVVDEHEAQLVRYASRLLGDVERARDVVQDTFLKLCRADRASVDGHVTEWLFTVCRNGALDIRRKEKRMTTSPETGLAAMAGPDTQPDARLEQDETMRSVLDWIALLPDSQQEVLRLKFQNGLSYKEIAAITKRTVNHVGVLIHNGMKTLRAKAAASPVPSQSGRSAS